MDDYASKLQEDLLKKLYHLSLIHEHSDWHVNQYFAELRSQIDKETEQAIIHLDDNKNAQELTANRGNIFLHQVQNASKEENIAELNASRAEFLRLIDEIEARTLAKLPTHVDSSSEDFQSLRSRIEKFVASSGDDAEDADEAYLELAEEIIAATSQVEKRILGDTTTIFIPTGYKTSLGCLIHFGEDYLTPQDLYEFKKLCGLELVDESLQVPLSRPLIFNKNHVIIRALKEYLYYKEKKNKATFFFVGRTESDLARRMIADCSLNAHFISCVRQEVINRIPNGFFQIDGIDASGGLYDLLSASSFKLVLENLMRPIRLDSSILSRRLFELVLENVHIEAFDQQALVQCDKLENLTIQATFAEDIQLDFEFLRSLKTLSKLRLVLPDSSVDMSVFDHIKNVELSGSSKLDANKMLRKLTSDQFKQLTLMSRQKLSLSYFEIESIGIEFSFKIESLHLNHNRIGRISECAFTNVENLAMENNEITDTEVGMLRWSERSSSLILKNSGVRSLPTLNLMRYLRELDLQANSIEELALGVFERAKNIEKLVLSKNRIRAIKKGVFGRMADGAELILDGNLIETIEPGAFTNLKGIKKLSLEGCRLKSINKETFKGLVRLESLNLANNCIESMDASEDGMFEGVRRLVSLNLSHNNLEKLDLNCFWNLTELKELNLESCEIKELNQQARPGLLANLNELNLRNNQLTGIKKCVFSQLTQLKTLDLFGNHLESLEDGFFVPFVRLNHVNLGRNRLTMNIDSMLFYNWKDRIKTLVLSENPKLRVTDRIFSNFSDYFAFECDTLSMDDGILIPGIISHVYLPRNLSLQLLCEDISSELRISKLTLRNDMIRILRRGPTQGVSGLDSFDLSWLGRSASLTKMDFSGNHIETLDDPNLFATFPKLAHINFKGNKLRHIALGVFGNNELKTLDLSNNCLECIDLGAFRGLTHLTRLDLTGNSITCLSLSRLLGACPTLEELLLADNQLDDHSISGPWHRGITKRLKKLVLANNQLESVDFFRDLTGLQHLDLSKNMIESIEQNGINLFGCLVKLTHLDLSSNRIKRFNEDVLSRMARKIEHLDISNNPFELDSVLSELI